MDIGTDNDLSATGLLVNIWVLESTLPRNDEVPILDTVRYNNVVGMTGVLRSNRTIWITAGLLLDYAFIFHYDSIQSGCHANAHGMANAFYTRYKLFTKPQPFRHMVTFNTIFDHVPFSHLNTSFPFPESGHHRVYAFLAQMKRNADSVLWIERIF